MPLNRTTRKHSKGRRHKTGKRRGERGQSIVEMAFVLPALLLLLAIVVDAARAFDAYIVLTNAAREGARFASLEYPLDDLTIKELVVQDVLGSGSNITHLTEFSKSDIALQESTAAVTVTVSYDFPLWFGGLLGMDKFDLEKEAVMPRRGDIEGP